MRNTTEHEYRVDTINALHHYQNAAGDEGRFDLAAFFALTRRDLMDGVEDDYAAARARADEVASRVLGMSADRVKGASK